MDTTSSTTGPDNPDLILSLVPLNRKARDTFERSINWKHYHRHASTNEPKEQVTEKDERETTPTIDIPEEEQALGEDESTLQLSFAHPPRHPPSGYVFGSDADVCDIFLGSRSTGISSIMFSIKYTTEGHLVLHSQSETNQIMVSYEKKEKAEQRSIYVWDLLPEKPNITVTLANKLVFSFRFPSHGDLAPTHQDIRDTFIGNADNGCLSILQLNRNIHHSSEDDCGAIVPFNQKVYTRFEELGAGGFGCVHEVAEASTAARFAMKTLFPGHVRYKEYRVARDTLKKEVATLASLRHRRIVRYYGVFRDSNSLCMVMELLSQGDLQNLLDQTGPQGLTDAQVSVILWQGLEALEYLHAKNITHRDLKPKNIMVVQFPLFRFKLVDFGLSHAPTKGQTPKSRMKTFCGTYEFLAPEQWIVGIYTNKVDIWALAVVVMYCLKIQGDLSYSECSEINWCTNLMNAIESAATKRVQTNIRRQLVKILSQHMIQLEADSRRSAQELLKQYDGFFNFLQRMETAVESRNPQVSFEFDAELTKEINNLEKGLESHCKGQHVARDTTAKGGNILSPNSRSTSHNGQALDQREKDPDAAPNQPENSREGDQSQTPAGEEDEPLDLFHDKDGQFHNLFQDEHGHPVDLFGEPLTNWQTQSQLAKAGPNQKHSRQTSDSSEAVTEVGSKKRRL